MESKCNAPNGMNTFISHLFILGCLGLSTRWERGVWDLILYIMVEIW